MIVIWVEGNIGSGKSTFLENIGEVVECAVVFERVPVKHLEKFYRDPEYALGFQLIMASERAVAQDDALDKERRYNTKLIFLERSLHADLIFAKNCLKEEDYRTYKNYRDRYLIPNYHKPDAVIYLRSTPEGCYTRIKRRMTENTTRKCEDTIPIDYLERLHEGHENWLMTERNEYPVIVFHTEEYDWRDLNVTAGLAEHIKNVLEVCKK